jgi:hypothetical protein
MKFLSLLFDNNRKWAAKIKRRDPEYFDHLSKIQKSEYLWIGCADSRVPANEIVGLASGELFVHRNIANIAPPFDTNVHSVLQFAVEALHVKHIIVCGHYGCGGVFAALQEWSGCRWKIGSPMCAPFTALTTTSWMPRPTKKYIGVACASRTSWLKSMRCAKLTWLKKRGEEISRSW